MSIRRPRIAFLFKVGRKARLGNSGDYPTEFLYGYPQLVTSGLDVTLLEDNAFGLHRQNRPWNIVSSVCNTVIGIHPFAVWRFSRPGALERINQFDVVIVTTATFGFSLALLKMLGCLRPSVHFIVMGAIDIHLCWMARWMRKKLLNKTTIIPISKSEQAYLQNHLHEGSNIRYLPFGVDHNFWTPRKRNLDNENKPYVLSIGNDLNRDYLTLVKAWKPEYPELRIVTRLPIPGCGENVRVLTGEWSRQLIDDAEIRELYRNALFVVLPIQETIQPSGQSACLQAMACGKAVVLSETQGLWDRSLMTNGQTCILVRPGSSEALSEGIDTLVYTPDRAEDIGSAARKIVENHLNTEIMANRMSEILSTA